MIKPYAARISESTGFIQEVPLFIDFWPDESSDEVTYVRLRTNREKVRGEQGFIASIPVRHPSGIIIDDQNWAGFLHLYLTQRDKMRRDYTGFLIHTRGCKSIRGYPSFGCYCFIIEGVADDYGIVIDRPTKSPRPLRFINHATIIKTPYRSSDGSGIYYDDHGLVLKKERADRVIRPHHEIYHISFLKPLTGSQTLRVYLEGSDKLNISSEMLHKATDEWELEFHSIEGFEYFKSVDEKAIFTLQKEPLGKAFHALQSRCSMEDADESLKSIYVDIVMMFANSPYDKTTAIDILSKIISALENHPIPV